MGEGASGNGFTLVSPFPLALTFGITPLRAKRTANTDNIVTMEMCGIVVALGSAAGSCSRSTRWRQQHIYTAPKKLQATCEKSCCITSVEAIMTQSEWVVVVVVVVVIVVVVVFRATASMASWQHVRLACHTVAS